MSAWLANCPDCKLPRQPAGVPWSYCGPLCKCDWNRRAPAQPEPAAPTFTQEQFDRAGEKGKALSERLKAQDAAWPAVAPTVACITECEACFTPDACQLRGKCDYYTAEQLRVCKSAAPTVVEPVAHCALTPAGKIAYFDGKPMVMVGPVGNEHHPTPLYLAATPPRAALTDEQIDAVWDKWFGEHGFQTTAGTSTRREFARAVIAADRGEK